MLQGVDDIVSATEVRRLAPEPLPDLSRIGAGADSTAYRAGELVIRASRRSEVADHMRFEMKLLERLRGRLPLRVPSPVWLEVRDGIALMAHHFEPGAPFDRSTFDSLSGPAQDLALQTVRDFWDELHSYTGEARDMGAERAVPFDSAEVVEVHVFPHLTSRERQLCLEALRIGDSGDVALVHHDLAPDHLLHADGTLVALIDFGDACLSDPIAEIGGRLLNAYGEDFALRILKGNRDALSAAGAYELWDRLGGAANRVMETGPQGAELDWVRRRLASR
ncbi:aminoglycoside phosphotransferase family protein [Actinopolymorpha sp. B17G11]|uniref:aminoglycoside phosphotransferase family protein n=1 Tax=Actinopolymorpha sp. B17G11 TaxID=3160861 RepID=UPI0032E3B648